MSEQRDKKMGREQATATEIQASSRYMTGHVMGERVQSRQTGRSLGGVISKTLVFSFFGGLSHAACGILVLNLRPLQWTCRVLTIGLQGNCQEKYFLLLFPQYISANFAKRKPLFHKNYFHIKLLCSNDFYVWTHHVD